MRIILCCLVLIAACYRAADRTTDSALRAAGQDEKPEGAPRLDRELRIRASANGKYEGLAQTLRVDEDRDQYGDFHDYGYYSNTEYKGHTDLPAGYWVYVAPHWYIWSRLAQ